MTAAQRSASRQVPAWMPGWAVLAICCMAQFMVVLDVAIVNVALPQMRHDLGLSVTGQQWVVNAYTLTFAGLLMLGGRAADLFGRRRVFMLGLALFTCLQPAGRAGPERRLAHRRPGGPGRRRCHPGPRHAEPADHPVLRAGRAAPGAGCLVRHRRQRGGHRRPRRGHPDRPAELALGAVRQRAHRDRPAGRRLARADRVPPRRGASLTGPARRPHRDGRPVHPRLRHREHRYPLVGLGPDGDDPGCGR